MQMKEALERFDHFNDSVIEAINIGYADGPSPHIQVVLHCQDDRDPERRRRQCVLNFRDVEEFKLVQPPKTTLGLLSFGVAFVPEAGLFYIDFDCLGDVGRTIEEVRAGAFYIGAREIEISVR